MNEVIIKTPEEIEKMRELGKLVAEALDYIGQFVKPGITTNEIDKLVYDYHVNVQGGYPAPLHYGNPPYPKSCCTSVNHVICHGIPDDKPLKEGDIINIDLTIKKDGFHGDSSRMFAVGKISPIAQRLIDVTHESMMAGIAAVKPGATLGDVGYACQQVAENAGYSVVQEFCGHGIGRGFHEAPQVLHYGRKGQGLVLKPGMIFTIEPMINQGKRHLRILPDGWTVVTKDRSLSAQWEHEVLVTETGCEILTISPASGKP
ncbi:methionine aminopeptidase, type I [Neisseria sp. oral taxon 014 str. F0314]|jgi:methionine aminopeptidase, type I|uniref:type I methionyl aminopeptidase n=1 Tax=Neisseria sp. oral taxon 014 TaxID=641148 RepID=UPI0001D8CA5C|nr:type I methionyl aminopeptidase [Neisseria sp. oral taxon 014]EFI23287.1 methionine aminopeptidase, type I [Neisseria sp. oral taxon 014 str. F0314]